MNNKLTVSMFETTEGVGQRIDIMGDITTRFANLCAEKMDSGIRAKLLELGWSPPGSPEVVPFNVVREMVRARTKLGLSSPESQEEQAARAIELIRELCHEILTVPGGSRE